MALDIAATFGPGKLIKDGGECNLNVDEQEYIGIYFSAHWCPPCQAFTPVLAEYYEAVKANGGKFEIVFVSSDNSEAEFNNYFKEMPWFALKFEDRELKGQLSGKYGVQGIPTLIILNKRGDLVTNDGRKYVMKNKSTGVMKWN